MPRIVVPARCPGVFYRTQGGAEALCGIGCRKVWTTPTAKPWASDLMPRSIPLAGGYAAFGRALGDGLWEVRTSACRVTGSLASCSVCRRAAFLVLHGFIRRPRRPRRKRNLALRGRRETVNLKNEVINMAREEESNPFRCPKLHHARLIFLGDEGKRDEFGGHRRQGSSSRGRSSRR